MSESNLRKWHRRTGIILSIFIILQAGSGLLLSLGELGPGHSDAPSELNGAHESHEEDESLWHERLEFIHHEVDGIGTFYRIAIGIGLLGVAISGVSIFLMTGVRRRSGVG